MEGWIKLHRSIINWEWYSDSNVMRLFIHCILKANTEDKKWRGLDIKRGQFFTSIGHLAEETSMSVKAVRIALDKLIKTKSVASETANNGTKITILKYDDYQIKQKTKGQTAGQTKGEQGANEGQQLKNIRILELKKLGVADDFLDNVYNWLEYKKSRKESYRNDISIMTFYNKLLKLSSCSQKLASEIIEQSMANNWAGIFELRQQQATQKPKRDWAHETDFPQN